jgi:hypothetical protein
MVQSRVEVVKCGEITLAVFKNEAKAVERQ